MFGDTENTQIWGMLVEHLDINDATKNLLWASLGYNQLAVSILNQLLSLDFSSHQHIIQDTWVKYLWKVLDSCTENFHIQTLCVPQLHFKSNQYLMDVVRRAVFSITVLREAFNTLNVHTVSDIVTFDGNRIKQEILTGSAADINSMYNWPRNLPWGSEHKQIMEYLIKYLAISTKKLVTRLGDFTTDAFSQSYLVHYEKNSNGLIDSRGGKKSIADPFPTAEAASLNSQ